MPIITDSEYYFTSSDGFHQIHVREWTPDCDINGVIQLVHGISEYVGRYEAFARFLASKGFVVVGGDHLGHGGSVRSSDELGFFAYENGWELVLSDVEKLREATRKRYPDVPYFIFGHSMGSFLTRNYLIKHPEAPLTGVILSGTGQVPLAVAKAGAALCTADIKKNGDTHRSDAIYNIAFGSYNKSFEPKRTKFDWLTRDDAVVDAYAADPLCTVTPTSSLFRDMMRGIVTIGTQKNLESMNKNLPILFISGTMDPVGGNGSQVAKVYGMFLKAGMKDVFYKFYEGARHELTNELCKDEVYKDVLDWVFEKIK